MASIHVLPVHRTKGPDPSDDLVTRTIYDDMMDAAWKDVKRQFPVAIVREPTANKPIYTEVEIGDVDLNLRAVVDAVIATQLRATKA